MSRIFIPEELTLLHLVAFPDAVTLPFRTLHEALHIEMLRGDSREAKKAAENLERIASSAGETYIAALAHLYLADVTRHQHTTALRTLTRAVTSLHNESRAIARYNEALGYYLQGIIHCARDKDAEVSQSFGRATQLLEQARHRESFFGAHPRSPDIEKLIRWMTELLMLGINTRNLNIAPLYEPAENGTLQFCGATAIDTGEIELPRSTLPPLEETYFVIELPPAPASSSLEIAAPKRRYLIKPVWGEDPQSVPKLDQYGRFRPGERRSFEFETDDRITLGDFAGMIL